MVAIALLSIGLVLLLQVQARSIQLAQQAREMTVATQLARAKLYDCETDLLKKGEDVSDIRDALIFGQAFAAGGALADPNAAVAALSDDEVEAMLLRKLESL
mgnify:CR=1 FL=1